MKAKRSSVWFSLSLILIAILSLVSCQISTPPSAEVKGDISFNFDLSGAKAAGYNITKVHIKMTHQDAGIVKEQDLTVDNDNNKAYGTISGLRIGTWDVLAELYENDTEVGSGTSQVTIEAGKTAEVHIRINLDTGSANIVVEWGEGSVDDEIVNKYYENAKLVLKVETGAEFDFDKILNDANLNAVEVDEGAYWDFDLSYPTNEYFGKAGFPEITIRVFATKNGDMYVGPISGSAEEQLKLLVFGGMGNYSNFDGSILDQSVYGEPKNNWLECTIRQNFLANILHWDHWGDNSSKAYKYLYNKGYVKNGPSNTYEFFNKKFTLYNLYGNKITVVFSGIHHQQFDYGWYNESYRPIHEAMNRKWSPIANNPDQDADLSRSFNLSYSGSPQMSAVVIWASNDNSMWSQVKIYGIHDVEDYTSNGGEYRHWYIEYDPDEETYMVKTVNCSGSAVQLKNVYPTKVEMTGYTTWSSFSPSFKMAVVGGDVTWSNVQESPSPGDDGNPEPMKCVIQPGANVIGGE